MQKQAEAPFVAGLTLCGHYHESTGSRNMPRHFAETVRELNESTFSPSVWFFVLVASFLFNVKLPSSSGQTAGSPASLTHFLFIIFTDALLLSCLLRLSRIKRTAKCCVCTRTSRWPLEIRAQWMNVAGTSMAPLHCVFFFFKYKDGKNPQ